MNSAPIAYVVSPTLDARMSQAVLALCTRATEADGVHPLSEHVTLHLRHGGDGHDQHVLALRSMGGDQHVLGYAHLDPTDAVAGAAAELVVDPAERGAGIGRELVTTVRRI